MVTIFAFLIELIKFAMVFVNRYFAFKAEEKALFLERAKTMTDAISRMISKQQDALNEEAYLSNREWEYKIRFNNYKAAALSVLVNGGGITELTAQTTMGMGTKVMLIKPQLVPILTSIASPADKAAYIAKALVEAK